MTLNFPPGLILMALALVLPLVKGRAHGAVALLATCVTLGFTLLGVINGVGEFRLPFLPGTDLNLLQLNAPTKVFATIFSLMAVVGTLFAIHRRRAVEMSGALLYAGAAICATFAGDLLSMFIYWEIMAVGSTLVVWSGGQRDSGAAGWRYAAVHFVGGALLLAGIAAWAAGGGSLALPADPLASPLVASLSQLDSVAAWLMLLGILINAGTPPLGAWLADAYPEASESGAVFLSAFTTKTAVFVLMMLFAGTNLLIWIGMAMAVYGIIFAILENDVRRILAYSIVNQVGFMVCAIGIGSELSLAGASAHAFAHIIYKALLLMSAGSVMFMTGKRKCTEVGGLYHSMPITMWCGIIGALAISAVPLTSGFTSKSLITSAAAELGNAHSGDGLNLGMLATFVLMAASAGVFLHAGIKFPWFVFFQKDSGLRPADPPWNMRVAMMIFAGLCLGLGVWVKPLYEILPYVPMHLGADGHAHAYEAWTVDHVISQFQLLLFAGLAFFLLLPMLKRTLTITLDGDWFYRRFCPQLWRLVLGPVFRFLGRPHAWVTVRLPVLVAAWVQSWHYRHTIRQDIDIGHLRADMKVDINVDRGRQWAIGGVLVVVTSVLGLYLLLLLTGWA